MVYLYTKKDIYLLELIKTFFGGVGTIASHGKTKVQYRVSSVKDLQVIIQHFDSFPLIYHKWSDFQLFKSAFELVKYKKHLTLEGLIKIVSIKASMNLGLPVDLSQKIIPFFKTYPVLGVKSLDYSDFCEAVEIIKVKKHLTEEGLAKIEKIKSGMNTKRVA